MSGLLGDGRLCSRQPMKDPWGEGEVLALDQQCFPLRRQLDWFIKQTKQSINL